MNAKQLAHLLEDEMSNHLVLSIDRNSKNNFAQLSCEAEDGSTFSLKIIQLDEEEDEEAPAVAEDIDDVDDEL